MKKLSLALVLALCFLPEGTFSQTYVELDGDGVLGNGPDLIGASPGDTVEVDVWLHHDIRLCDSQVYICSSCAQFVSVQYHLFGTGSPPVVEGDCTAIQWADFFCDGVGFPPYRMATVQYAIAECPCGLTVDDSQSVYTDDSFQVGTYSGSIPVGLCQESTSTQSDAWGGVKRLFR